MGWNRTLDALETLEKRISDDGDQFIKSAIRDRIKGLVNLLREDPKKLYSYIKYKEKRNTLGINKIDELRYRGPIPYVVDAVDAYNMLSKVNDKKFKETLYLILYNSISALDKFLGIGRSYALNYIQEFLYQH